MKKLHPLAWRALLASIACSSTQASAIEDISMNGFASVGGGWFSGDSHTSTYRGYDQEFQADPVVKFGLQVSAQVNDKVSVTGQLLAKGSNDYNVEGEWAYLTYAANDDWDVRIGRLRAPFFPYSDFLDVGYAYPWITPPSEVYRFIFNTVEGVDTLYRTSLGEWDTTFQAYYGRLTDETSLGGEDVEIDLSNFTGLNASFTRDWLTLRVSYNYAKVDIESPADLAGLIGVLDGVGFSDEASALEIDQESAAFYGVAALVDYNDWLFNTEYTEINQQNQSFIGDDSAWYVMLGKRIDDFTFHVTYAKQESDHDLSFLDGIPDGVAVPPAGITDLKATVIGAIGESESSSVTLGMRYDFAEATSFKVEVTDRDDKIDSDPDGSGDGTLINFSLDTVF